MIPFDLSKYNTISELLNAPEGEHFEFKEAKSRFDFDLLAKYACAISNCGGGKIILGITDERPRQIVGTVAFEQPERTRLGLIERLHIGVNFQLLYFEEKRILVFEISSRPVGLPVAINGIGWWRIGDELLEMPENVRRSIYAEGAHDFSADICAEATITDLDEIAIEIFRNIWIEKADNKRLAAMSVEQLLCDCDAISDKGITYAALILFGRKEALTEYLAQSEIVFEYRSSEMAGPAQQREEFREAFFSFYDKLWFLIDLRNDTQHYQEGFLVFDVPTFNERVVREALLNAVSHRNYQLPGSVFIRQYRDRLEIDSPGGFPPEITEENILDRQSPRNRRIAEILAKCGLVERSGQGMNLIYEMCIKEAKALPDFRGTDSHLVHITIGGLILDGRQLLLLKQIGQDKLEHFSTDDLVLIHKLYYDQKVPEKLQKRLDRMVNLGIVEHVGRKKYVLARKFYEVVGKAGIRTRIVGLDRETNKELLLKHIKEMGSIGSQFRELQQVLPGLSRPKIQTLLRELRSTGKIYLRGTTSNARWFSQ